jgi:hypothetical protein
VADRTLIRWWMRPLMAAGMVVTASGLAAADLELCDLRAGGGYYLVDLSSSDSSGAASQTVAYGSAISFMRGDLGRYGGVIYGGELAVIQDHYTDNGRYASLEAECVKGFIGYAYAPFHQWHVELTPEAGIGYLFQTRDVDGQTVHGRGRAFIWGGRIGLYYTIHHLQFGLEGMHERIHGHLLADVLGDNGLNRRDSRTLTTAGSGIALDLGIRF